MTDVVTKAALSPARRRLVELMQEINYGRIERLEVRDGEPVFDPPPIVLRLFLFGKDNGPNAPAAMTVSLSRRRWRSCSRSSTGSGRSRSRNS